MVFLSPSTRFFILVLCVIAGLSSSFAQGGGQRELIEEVKERVDTLLSKEMAGDWELYRGRVEDGKETGAFDTLRSCPDADTGVCLLAEWSYVKGMAGAELYRGAFRDAGRADYLAVVDIAAISSWGNYLLFFEEQEGQLHRVGKKDVSAKGSFNGVEFHPLLDTGLYTVLARYEQSPSTYVDAGIELFQWVGDSVYTVFDTTTLFYDWKHYGKRFYELGDMEDSLADDEAYRELREVHFKDTNGDGVQEILVRSREAVVERIGRETPYREFPEKERIKEEKAVLFWDEEKKKYLKGKE